MSTPRRVQIFGWGPVTRDYYHPQPDGSTATTTVTFEVDQQFFEDMLASFTLFAAVGFYPGILAEHDATPKPIPGLVFGRVVGVEADARGIWALVRWARGMEQLFDDGFIDTFSPGIERDYPHPHEPGVVLPVVLHEVSITGQPYLHNIANASPYYGEDLYPTMRAGFVFARQPARPIMDPEEDQQPTPAETPEDDAQKMSVVNLSEDQMEDLSARVAAKLSATFSANPPATPGAKPSAEAGRIAALEFDRLSERATLKFGGNPPAALMTQLRSLPFSQAVGVLDAIPTPTKTPAGEGGQVGQAAAPPKPAAKPGKAEAVKVMRAAREAKVEAGQALYNFARAQGVDPDAVDPKAWMDALDEVY